MVAFGAERSQMGVGTNLTRLEFTKDRCSMRSESCRDDGKFFTGVEGVFKRSAAPVAKADHVPFVGTQVSPSMTSLAPMVGAWNVAGAMVMAPGGDKMDIKGVETTAMSFGGHVLMSSVVGEPANGMPAYLGHTYTVWNETRKLFDVVNFDNMGMAVAQTGLWTDPGKTLVVTGSMIWMGEPSVQNTKLRFGPKGLESVVSHAIGGAAAIDECFTATYTKAAKSKP